MSNTIAAWVEAIGTWFAGIVTLLVLLWAIFHDCLYDWMNRPRLSVSIDPSSPDCMKLVWGERLIREGNVVRVFGGFPVYYLRLRVSNDGGKADGVQVRLAKVERLGDGDSRKKVSIASLANLNLTWARQEHGTNLVFLPSLYRGASEHCNLAHVFKPSDRESRDVAFLHELKDGPGFSPDKTILSLDIADRPSHLPHLVPPGSYRFHVIISSADTKPRSTMVDVTLSGEWYDEQGEMFENGIIVKTLGQNIGTSKAS